VRFALLFLVACGKTGDKPAALDKLTVTVDGKPVAINGAFIKRTSPDAYTVNLGGSCEIEKNLGFNIMKRVAPMGHETFAITDLWSREFDAKIPLPAKVKLDNNTVEIDVHGDKLSLVGSFAATACPDVVPTGMGVPKAAHPSKATILVAGKKVPVRGATVQVRAGVEATDLPNIVLSSSPRDCSGVELPAPLILERTDGKWTLRGTWFETPIAGDDPGTLTFSANSTTKTPDGNGLVLQLSGKAKIGEYSVELFDTVEAVECLRH
jgi:uncharacterized Zn-binding protein involved in type VI secretion